MATPRARGCARTIAGAKNRPAPPTNSLRLPGRPNIRETLIKPPNTKRHVSTKSDVRRTLENLQEGDIYRRNTRNVVRPTFGVCEVRRRSGRERGIRWSPLCDQLVRRSPYTNRVFVGRQGSQLIGQSIESFILVFLSTAGPDVARIAISGRYHASEEGPVWRLLNARLSGDRLEWVDNRNGHSASDQMRWTDPNTGTFTGNPPQYGGFFTPFNGRFTRLD